MAVNLIIVAAVGAAIFFAVRSLVKNRKNGGCAGCGGGCGSCGGCSKEHTE